MIKLILISLLMPFLVLSNAHSGILDDLKKEGVRVNLNNELCKANEISNEDKLEKFIYFENSLASLDGFDKFCGKNVSRDLNSIGISGRDYAGWRMFVQSQIPGCFVNNASINIYRKFQDEQSKIIKLLGCKEDMYYGYLNQLRKVLQK